MTNINIKMKMPAIEKEFHASYSNVERPSGIEYTLLTIIGTDGFRNLTWDQIMKKMGIPDNIFSTIFLPSLEKMVDVGMIETRGWISSKNHVGESFFTEVGKQAFDQGVIARRTEKFQGSIVNRPAEVNGKYVVDKNLNNYIKLDGLDAKRYDDIEPDIQRIENQIIKDKGKFNIQKDMEVFDIQISEEKAILCYLKDAVLSLNETNGNLSLEAESLDDNFLKSKMTIDDFTERIEERFFQSSVPDVVFKSWRNSSPADWDSYSFVLPLDIKFNGHKLVVINSESCETYKFKTLDDRLGCDIVHIDGAEIGYEYCLINHEMSISGFDGERKLRLAIRRRIESDRIMEIIKMLIEEIGTESQETLEEALTIASVGKDAEMSKSLIKDYLTKSKNPVQEIVFLKSHDKAPWRKDLDTLIEEFIVSKGLNPSEAGEVLKATDTKVSGHVLADAYAAVGSDSIMTVDALSDHVKDRKALIRTMGADKAILDMILAGESGGSSEIMTKATNASRILSELKVIFNMKSCSEYEFNFEDLAKDDVSKIVSKIATFQGDLSQLRTDAEAVRTSDDLNNYTKLLVAASSALKELNEPVDVMKLDEKDFLKMNDILFGIRLGTRLEKRLYNLVGVSELNNGLIKAKKEGKISEEDYSILNELRKYRNECAHYTENVKSIDKARRRRMLTTVDNLKPVPNTEEKK